MPTHVRQCDVDISLARSRLPCAAAAWEERAVMSPRDLDPKPDHGERS